MRRHYQIVLREFVLREVHDWMMRGESTLSLPRACYRDHDGKSIVGWRVQLVAECLPTREHFDPNSSWDSPSYMAIAQRGLGWMSRDRDSSPLMMVIVGIGTPFEDGKTFFPAEIPGDTILFVEVVRRELKWLEPVDITVNDLRTANGGRVPEWIRSDLGDGIRVIFADGKIWCLSRDVPVSLLLKYVTVDTDLPRNREEDFAKYRQPAWEVRSKQLRGNSEDGKR